MRRFSFQGWTAEVSPAEGGRFIVSIGGERREVRLLAWEEGLLSFEAGGRVVSAAVEAGGGRVEVVLGGRRAVFPLEDAPSAEGREAARGAGLGPLRAELPGRVLEVAVREGDRVEAGQVLLRIEAMKMEHALRAGAPARVGRVRTRPGAQIAQGEVLLELLPPGS